MLLLTQPLLVVHIDLLHHTFGKAPEVSSLLMEPCVILGILSHIVDFNI